VAPMVGPHYSQLAYEENDMTKLTAFDLTPFYRNSIGIDRVFDRIINQIDHAASTNYPPYNIVETGENTFELQLAVAGFSQGEIDVSTRDGEIVISGEKQNTVLPEGHSYKHQGISSRKFMRSWTMGEYVEVIDATQKDGILTVKFERRVPEAIKPKSIAITYTN
jgi:molecular chaperone IbpA